MIGEDESGDCADDFRRVDLEVKAIRRGFGRWRGYWSYVATGNGTRLWMVADIHMTRRRALRSARRAYARNARPLHTRTVKADQEVAAQIREILDDGTTEGEDHG